jgi:hypothetical protein
MRTGAQDKRLSVFKNPVAIMMISLLLSLAAPAGAEEYSFDLSETEKKPWHLGGYAELKPVLFGLDRDAALYKLKFHNRNEGATLAEYNGALQLEGSVDYGIARFFVRTNTDYKNSYLGSYTRTTAYEGFLSLKPSSSFTLDLGKRTMKWGKGYAWNPVAFVDRPKDPDEPDLNLEGFVVATADYIMSFSGPLKTVSFTPVLIPVYKQVNDDFGTADSLNAAGKMYALLYDTDIDLMFLAGGGRTTRYGADFSRNITTNIEVHGEYAVVRNFTRKVVDGAGTVASSRHHAESLLFGFRYLTELDTTYIFEYYHNGAGYTAREMQGYFQYIDTGFNAYQTTGNAGALVRAASLLEGGYGRPNPMRDYLYLRVSQKEPFDILYFTPAMTGVYNVHDRSWSLSPELLYTAITNLELRLKTMILAGERLSEFGEKLNEYRVEFRARYYF